MILTATGAATPGTAGPKGASSAEPNRMGMAQSMFQSVFQSMKGGMPEPKSLAGHGFWRDCDRLLSGQPAATTAAAHDLGVVL